MEQYSKNFYLSNIANIESTYQNWGVDISSLLDNIKKTDLEAYKAFLMLYKKEKETFIKNNDKKARLFYEKICKLSLDSDRLDIDFKMEPLNKYLEKYKYSTSFVQNTYDHILSLLLLSEEFLFNDVNTNDNISYFDNKLYARSDNVEFYMKKTGDNKSCSQIIIPNEMVINFKTKVYKLKK